VNIEYARGIYQGEGSFTCGVNTTTRTATPKVTVAMTDADALRPLEACLGTKMWQRKGVYRMERAGKAAVDIADTLATTPTKRRQIQDALQRCRQQWQKGFRDRIPQTTRQNYLNILGYKLQQL